LITSQPVSGSLRGFGNYASNWISASGLRLTRDSESGSFRHMRFQQMPWNAALRGLTDT
jgi:hypothetical protein